MQFETRKSYRRIPANRFICGLLAAFLTCLHLPADSLAGERRQVAMELLIAVDVSHSVDASEHRLQVQGLAQAFRNPGLIRMLSGQRDNRIAAAVMFWAGEKQQIMAVPWTVLDSERAIRDFAEAIAAQAVRPWSGLSYTAIGNALLRAADEIALNDIDSRRQYIDLSGDDPANQGIDPATARDRVVASGIVINGLPILAGRVEHEERQELFEFYRTQVTGGSGAFVIPALDFPDFARAMFSKLMREIADGLRPVRGTRLAAAVAPAGPAQP